MTAVELVIFDCDGVLVDSERIANQVFCTMLNDLGLSLSLQDMLGGFVGLSMPQCVELITDLQGKAPPSAFIDEVRLRTACALKEEIKPIPGIEATLAALQEFWAQIGVEMTPALEPFPALLEHIAQTFDFEAFVLGFR